MSSLLQFQGQFKGGKVGLIFQLGQEVPYSPSMGNLTHWEETDQFACPRCGRQHPNLYVAFRRCAGMLGHFVLFNYNGATHAPDLSIPIQVAELPRGAQPMAQKNAVEYWHSVL